jgi:hypothetical protein
LDEHTTNGDRDILTDSVLFPILLPLLFIKNTIWPFSKIKNKIKKITAICLAHAPVMLYHKGMWKRENERAEKTTLW